MPDQEITGLPRLVCIFGPTGVGKTALAMELAERSGGEIISADSMQVYRFMDIGTSKPSREERDRVSHHLLDVVNPDQPFDASRYIEMANVAISRLAGMKKPIYVAGGTGLYVRALLGGLIEGPPADEALRENLRAEIEKKGKAYLHEVLKIRDPRAALVIHPNDAVRIIRALEVLELTGRSIVAHQEEHRFRKFSLEVLRIGLYREREELNIRIDSRADSMMAAGFFEEVESLLARGYEESLKPMQALGYRHLIAVIRGRMKAGEAVERIKRDTRLYAKRQMTWFSAERDVVWLHPDEGERAKRLSDVFFGKS